MRVSIVCRVVSRRVFAVILVGNARRAVLAVLGAVAVSVPVVMPAAAYADAPVVDDLDQVTAAQAVYYAGYSAPDGVTTSQDNRRLTFTDTTAVPDGDPVTSMADTWYIGSTTLNNDSDVDQTLSTQSFSQQISEALSTSVTKGLSTTASVSAKFSLPGEEETASLSQTVSFNETATKTSTSTQTYTAPPQSIKVPAHTSAKVTVVLQKVNATGKMSLHTNIGGSGDYSVAYHKPGQDGTLYNDLKNVALYDLLGPTDCYGRAKLDPPALPASFTRNEATHTVDFDGAGTYTATYGTDMQVDVKFTSNSSKTALGAPSPYHYTITPEHKKAG